MINYILSKSNILINYVGFTIVWFSCVYSGAQGDPIIAIIPTFIFLFLHFLIVTDHFKEEIQLIVISIIFGLIVDSSFSILGFVKYNGTLDFAPKSSTTLDSLYVGRFYSSDKSCDEIFDR